VFVLYWLVPPGRGAKGTGNQLSSDHFERADDYFGPGLQETKTFPDFRISGPDADLSDTVAHCASSEKGDFLHVIDVDYNGMEYKRQVVVCQGDFGRKFGGIRLCLFRERNQSSVFYKETEVFYFA
jgi:hypothetical protein